VAGCTWPGSKLSPLRFTGDQANPATQRRGRGLSAGPRRGCTPWARQDRPDPERPGPNRSTRTRRCTSGRYPRSASVVEWANPAVRESSDAASTRGVRRRGRRQQHRRRPHPDTLAGDTARRPAGRAPTHRRLPLHGLRLTRRHAKAPGARSAGEIRTGRPARYGRPVSSAAARKEAKTFMSDGLAAPAEGPQGAARIGRQPRPGSRGRVGARLERAPAPRALRARAVRHPPRDRARPATGHVPRPEPDSRPLEELRAEWNGRPSRSSGRPARTPRPR